MTSKGLFDPLPLRRAIRLARAGSRAETMTGMPSASRTFFTYSTTLVSLPGGSCVSICTTALKCLRVSASMAGQSGVWAVAENAKRQERRASLRIIRVVYTRRRGYVRLPSHDIADAMGQTLANHQLQRVPERKQPALAAQRAHLAYMIHVYDSVAMHAPELRPGQPLFE